MDSETIALTTLKVPLNVPLLVHTPHTDGSAGVLHGISQILRNSLSV